MDHKTLLASLSDADRLALTERSDGPGIGHLIAHLAAIIGLGGMVMAGMPGWPVLMAMQGVALVFLFTLLHETVHETPFASRWLNLWSGRMAGFVIGLPPEWFRYFHLAHHRHTNDPARDPELAEGKPRDWRGYLAYLSGLPVWLSHLRVLLRNARGGCEDGFLPERAKPRVRREAQWMIGLYLALLAGSAVMETALLLWIWILPMLLGQPFLRLYLLAEHGRCPPVANMLENSRTTFTTWLMRKLAWNMPYHAEHHAYPNVPFHRLPAFHALARPHLKQTERGYARFHARVIRALALGESRPL